MTGYLNDQQLKNKRYTLNQTDVGSPLRTLNGSIIKRSKYGIGKFIDGKLYFHKIYLEEVIAKVASPDVAYHVIEVVNQVSNDLNFDFNCIRFNLRKFEIALVESPDFDDAREPVVGKMVVIHSDGSTSETHSYNQIWHHKWMFVSDDYQGFDVAESWKWSRTWLSELFEKADGSNLANWERQLQRYNLQ